MNFETTSPLLKYTGGKTRELPFILPHQPSTYKRYIEPFAGGAAVYHAQQYFSSALLNDKSTDLINFYLNAQDSDKNSNLTHILTVLDNLFHSNIGEIAAYITPYLKGLVQKHIESGKQGKFDEDSLEIDLHLVSSYMMSIGYSLIDLELFHKKLKNLFLQEITSLFKKAIPKLIKKEIARKDEDKKYSLEDNFLTICKSAFYNTIRHFYNSPDKSAIDIKRDSPLFSAIYFFVHQYAFSNMHRFNGKGEFNVPYGGHSYNNHHLTQKIERLKSLAIQKKMAKTTFYNLDFEIFLKTVKPTKNDFIFLDPPYHSPFSKYDQNPFSEEDHIRLAKYLFKCKAKWLLVINQTEFTSSLYRGKSGIFILPFDKKYSVSIKNRNDNQAVHLLIANYPLEPKYY